MRASLAVGTRLGPYVILAPIDAGGMGEVFKARDTRLGRIVAIKVTKEKFSERFERGARAVAALNHPHICAIYEVGPDYLVMEYIEGSASKVLCRWLLRCRMGPRSVTRSARPGDQRTDRLYCGHRSTIGRPSMAPALETRPVIGQRPACYAQTGCIPVEHS